MSRLVATSLRHQVLLRTARLQQASVQLQLDRLSGHQSVRIADWVVGTQGDRRHWMAAARLLSGIWKTGVRGLLATALVHWIQKRSVS